MPDLTKLYNEAEQASLDNPNQYITLELIAFSLGIVSSKRLSVYTPDESYYPFYWLNGKRKEFSKIQKLTCQKAYNKLSGIQ